MGASFRQASASTSTGADTLDAATWRGFGDPALGALLARARAGNLDVRIAAQRLRQARAGGTVAASRLWPTVTVTGSVSDLTLTVPGHIDPVVARRRCASG